MKLNDYIGKAVKIVGKHPHYGKTGRAVRVETLPMLRWKGLLICFDDGTSSYVFDEKNLRLLKVEGKSEESCFWEYDKLTEEYYTDCGVRPECLPENRICLGCGKKIEREEEQK